MSMPLPLLLLVESQLYTWNMYWGWGIYMQHFQEHNFNIISHKNLSCSFFFFSVLTGVKNKTKTACWVLWVLAAQFLHLLRKTWDLVVMAQLILNGYRNIFKTDARLPVKNGKLKKAIRGVSLLVVIKERNHVCCFVKLINHVLTSSCHWVHVVVYPFDCM